MWLYYEKKLLDEILFNMSDLVIVREYKTKPKANFEILLSIVLYKRILIYDLFYPYLIDSSDWWRIEIKSWIEFSMKVLGSFCCITILIISLHENNSTDYFSVKLCWFMYWCTCRDRERAGDEMREDGDNVGGREKGMWTCQNQNCDIKKKSWPLSTLKYEMLKTFAFSKLTCYPPLRRRTFIDVPKHGQFNVFYFKFYC